MRGQTVWQDVKQQTSRAGLIKKARQADLFCLRGNSQTQTFLKISEPLVPPKPKELHRVYSIPLT